MKDIIRKLKIELTNLPRKLTINKVDVYNKSEIVDSFKDFFTNIGQKLASQIPKLSKTFETYINKVNVKGVFPDDLKIAKVTPIYKAGDYRPISVLPCFSEILELLMYNRLCKYLKENNILYEKQFGFQSDYSTNNSIVQLVDKIFDS